jgi:hypothetical protein
VKQIKAVIRYLTGNNPAEGIANIPLVMGFKVISVRQMTSTRPQASENLPLFLGTLPRSEKSQEIFQLTTLNHVIIKVEAYRFQMGLTQYYNSQQFRNVWVNCKQPPRCVWCGGGYLHRDCPEKEKSEFTPTCCNYKLAGEKPHSSNNRG